MVRNKTGFIQAWSWVVAGAPVWWFLGLNLWIYHLSAFFLFFALMNSPSRLESKIYFPPSFFWIFLIAITCLFSLLIHSFSSDRVRLLASFYNFTFWLMGCALILIMANVFSRTEIRFFVQKFLSLAWAIAIIAMVLFALILSGRYSVFIETPFYGLTRYLGHTPLIENSLGVNLIYTDWFASSQFPRISLFSPYAVAASEIVMIVMMMLMTWARIEKRTKSFFLFFLLSINFLAFLMTLSRTPTLAFFLSLVLIFFITKKRFLMGILVLLMLIPLFPYVTNGLDWILKIRAGSTLERVALYRYSIDKLEGVDWIIGMGLKPREEFAFAVPLGSHSTYFSLFFRTGIFGALIFLLFQAHLLWRWYRFKNIASQERDAFLFWQGLGWVFFGMVLCMMTDEIDVPQLLAFLYFSLVGVFEGLRRSMR